MVDDDLNSGSMHSLLEVSNGASHVPAFLAKLWKIVDDPNTNDLICWSEMGNSFLIRNQSKFAQELLPLYYKHNNMASFVRQLNMYGFHKVVSVDQGGLRNDKDEMEFAHPFFLRGSESTLELIKRKIPAAKLDDPRGTRPDSINKVLLDVRQMKGRQDSMDSKLMNVKRENEALWRELSVLRQKHAKQQQIVSKLLQFLVGMMSSQSHRIGFKRRMHMNVPLMLNDSDGLKGSKRNKNSGAELIGPVIRDVTDYDDSRSSLKKATTAASTAVSTMANTSNTTVATLQGFNLPSTSQNVVTSSADGSIEAQSMPTLMYIPGIDTPVEVVLSIPERDSSSPSALHDIHNDDINNPETQSGNVEMPVTPTSTGSADQTDSVLDTSTTWEGAPQSPYPSSSTAMQLRVPSPKTPILNADNESSMDGPSTQMVLSADGLRQDFDGHLDDVQAGLDNLTELLLKQDHYGIDSNTLLSLFDTDSDILSLQDVEALQDRDVADNTSSTPADEEEIAYNPSLYELTDDDIDE